MKSLIITHHRELGEALLEQQRKNFEQDKKFSRRNEEETFTGYVFTDVRNVDVTSYDSVVHLSTESYKPGDYDRILRATNYAEAGKLVEARAELDLCDRPYTSAWVKTDTLIEALRTRHERVKGRLPHKICKLVERRADILAKLFDNHPGGRKQLQLDKEPGTPGPASIERFHRYVAKFGLLPENDFGVRELALEYQPRGAYAHHVGWTRELREHPGRWLDVAWWVTLDVIGLFLPSPRMRESAEERLANVPSGLRDWRAFQIETAEGIEEFDAMLKAMKELGDR